MDRIEYECRILTPLFMSGANPSKTELRTPSIKGALRFWWRALSKETNLKKMKEKEGELFGNTEFRSKVLLRLDGKPKSSHSSFVEEYFQREVDKDQNAPIKFISYGVWNKPFIKPQDNAFTLSIGYRCSEEDKKQVEMAFMMASLFGGLGGKARNGFGSFDVKQEGFQFDEGLITKMIKSYSTVEQRSYTSLSKNMRVFKTKKREKKWENTLNSFANFYKTNKKSLQSEQRKYIGYPGERLKEELIGIEGLERHSKSYFFNIIKAGDTYEGLLLHLPYDFLNGIENVDKSKFPKERREEEAKSYQQAQVEFLNKITSSSSPFKEIK